MIEKIHMQEFSDSTKLDKKYFYEDYLDIDVNSKESLPPRRVNIYF